MSKFTEQEVAQLLENLKVAQWNNFALEQEIARLKAEVERLKDAR